MPKFNFKLSGLADVRAYAEVEAENLQAAWDKAQHPDTLMEVEWQYEGIREVTDCYPIFYPIPE